MQLQLKPQKTVELTCLEVNNHQTMYRLTYLEVSNCYVFTDEKLRNKEPLECLECKLE